MTDPAPRSLYRYADDATCSIEGCEKKPFSRGWCTTHYTRWHEHGDPNTVLKRISKRIAAPEDERFWKFVDTSGDCLIWTGARNQGYGTFGAGSIREGNRRQVKAHNFAYETVFGAIPDGLVLDHLCRNTLCVNPSHLEPVTNHVNVLRGISQPALNARKTHCVHGHEFTEANTHVDKNGARRCRACGAAKMAAIRKRRQHVNDA